MIDVHCHLLPEVDDGSQDAEMTLEMARMAWDNGTEVIIATPHCNIPGTPPNFPDRELYDRFLALRQLLLDEKLPLKVYAGAEVFCTPDFPEMLRAQRPLTLAGSRYLLTEFAFDEDSREIDQMLQAAAAEGYTPVLAHPERYDAVQAEPGLLERWFCEGYVLQLNKDSVLGRLGMGARRASHWALAHGLCHVIASDAHGVDRRTPTLASVRELISQQYAPELARILLDENPRRLLEDRPVLEA